MTCLQTGIIVYYMNASKKLVTVEKFSHKVGLLWTPGHIYIYAPSEQDDSGTHVFNAVINSSHVRSLSQ